LGTGKPLTTHQWYDGTQHPWEFKRVWHLEPSLTDPDTVYAGVEDAALFRSTDGGENWHELSGLAGHGTGPKWQPGAGGMCLHTIILDPSNPDRIFIAISAAGAFRTDDGGKTWKPINKGLYSKYIPNPTAEVGHCVHHVAMNPSRPGVLFMQKHWDVMRSDDAGDSSGIRSAGTCRLILDSSSTFMRTSRRRFTSSRSRAIREHYVPDGQAARLRSRSGGNEWEALTKGLPQSNCYVNVLRDAMAVDSLDECGVYFGTSGGQVYARPMQETAGTPSCAISGRAFRGGANTNLIRVLLPQHLRALAHTGSEVSLDVAPPVTLRAVVDALEARYPMLRGTIRDHVTGQRRPFLRFFACEEDLSHEPPDAPLPEAVSSGSEPLLIIGAIAGG
jgi:hypothetical protein